MFSGSKDADNFAYDIDGKFKYQVRSTLNCLSGVFIKPTSEFAMKILWFLLDCRVYSTFSHP